MGDPVFNPGAGPAPGPTNNPGPGPGPTSPGPATTTRSTYSGGGGSSAPAGPSEAEIRAMRNLRISFLEMLRRWGLPQSKNLLNLVEKGVRGLWSTTVFISFLRQTPDYKQKFRGIQWRTGMTEGSYLSTFAQYKARAQDIGENLTRKEFAQLLKKGVDFQEFSDRVDALSSIDKYGPLWGQFKFELEAAGVKVPGKELTKKELANFLMGLGPKQWEHVWQRAFLTTQLERVAGIEVTERAKGEKAGASPYEITKQDLANIIRQVEALSPGGELESLKSTDFAQIGQKLRQYKPDYLLRYGITVKDILTMELGGSKSAEIAEKAQRVLATQEAAQEERVTPTFGKIQQAAGGGAAEELPQSY